MVSLGRIFDQVERVLHRGVGCEQVVPGPQDQDQQDERGEPTFRNVCDHFVGYSPPFPPRRLFARSQPRKPERLAATLKSSAASGVDLMA